MLNLSEYLIPYFLLNYLCVLFEVTFSIAILLMTLIKAMTIFFFGFCITSVFGRCWRTWVCWFHECMKITQLESNKRMDIFVTFILIIECIVLNKIIYVIPETTQIEYASYELLRNSQICWHFVHELCSWLQPMSLATLQAHMSSYNIIIFQIQIKSNIFDCQKA